MCGGAPTAPSCGALGECGAQVGRCGSYLLIAEAVGPSMGPNAPLWA